MSLDHVSIAPAGEPVLAAPLMAAPAASTGGVAPSKTTRTPAVAPAERPHLVQRRAERAERRFVRSL